MATPRRTQWFIRWHIIRDAIWIDSQPFGFFAWMLANAPTSRPFFGNLHQFGFEQAKRIHAERWTGMVLFARKLHLSEISVAQWTCWALSKTMEFKFYALFLLRFQIFLSQRVQFRTDRNIEGKTMKNYETVQKCRNIFLRPRNSIVLNIVCIVQVHWNFSQWIATETSQQRLAANYYSLQDIIKSCCSQLQHYR